MLTDAVDEAFEICGARRVVYCAKLWLREAGIDEDCERPHQGCQIEEGPEPHVEGLASLERYVRMAFFCMPNGSRENI